MSKSNNCMCGVLWAVTYIGTTFKYFEHASITAKNILPW